MSNGMQLRAALGQLAVTWSRGRSLISRSLRASPRVRQGGGVIIIACIGAPCPGRAVIIGLGWGPGAA